MEIKIYGKENCSKCEAVKNYLDERKILYNYILDKKEFMIIASKNRIMSAPVIVINDKVYPFEKLQEVIR